MAAPQNNEQKALSATYWSLSGNIILAVIKGLAGYIGHSYALIADAIESVTDTFSSLLVWWGMKYAHKPPDKNHPYGHGKIEPLITILVVAFLLTAAAIIAFASIRNIQNPHKVPETWTLIVLGAIIVWKEGLYRLISNRGKETHSSSLQADAWHHRSDAITSAVAFIGILVAVVFGPGYETADDWAALVASGLIVYNSYRLLRPALGEIMDEHRYDDLQEHVHTQALQVPGVLATEKCYIRKVGMKYHVDLHAIVQADITVKEGHFIAHQLKDYLMTGLPVLENVLIHIEPYAEQS